MKSLAVSMVLVGAIISTGAVLEFFYFGPGTRQFLAGIVATPAGIFYAYAGIMLWRRRRGAQRIVLVAGLVTASATVACRVLDVMGVLATIVCTAFALWAVGWAWRHRTVPA